MTNKNLKTISHKIGDLYEIDDIWYEVRYVNNSIGFLFPLDNYSEEGMYYCCCAIKMTKKGKVTKL